MFAPGLSQAGVGNPTSNFIGRKETASMLDGIMYNTRQEPAQDRATSSKNNSKAETASVSTFSSEKPLLKEGGSSVRNLFKRS